MPRSLMIVLLTAATAAAAPVPKPPPPDPFEVGRMGITFTDEGLGVSAIEPSLPVAKSGLRVGDEFVSVGPVEAKTRRDIQLLVGGLRPGTKLAVVVNRNGERHTLTVMLGEADDRVKAAFRQLRTPAEDEPVP